MRGSTRVLIALAVACTGAVLAAASAVSSTRHAAAAAETGCQLTDSGQVKHVVYLQFDNTHYRRDNPDVPSDLEQMPHLLDFLTSNGTLFTNDHTILISHTAGGIVSTLTGLYPDRNGLTVSNSYDYYRTQAPNAGLPTNTSAFKYWTAPVDGADDSKPNLIAENGLNTPAPWVPFTRAGCDVGGVSTANIELENANAIVLTTLAAAASAGDTNIKVTSVNGFAPGQTITIDPSGTTETRTITAVGTAGSGGTGITLDSALSAAHAQGTQVYVTDQAGDLTKVYGEGSPEWIEGRNSQLAASGTAARALAQTDFVGIAIHCGTSSSSKCAGNANARPDPLPDEPGGYSGLDFHGLFGAKYVNQAIAGGPCVQATDGTSIADSFGQCGFPGFDGALAKNTLGEVLQMQESGIPVTFAYISDAHDNHTLARASGPGEADYKQQLAEYDAAFATFFQQLQAHGIDKSNTLFVVTVDEGDHFAGGVGVPDGNGNLVYAHTACSTLTACPSNQIGEVNANIKSLLTAADPTVTTGFDIHFDDAPTFYVNGQPGPTDAAVRKLERDVGSLQAVDPYVNHGASVPLTVSLADVVEEQTLHMINADSQRTPTFTMFGNPDFFFQTTNPSCGGNPCVNPGFAWNHGDVQDEIGNTWLGLVGPGVKRAGVDSTTWTDHTNVRPTLLALAGLKDDYVQDGRVLIEALESKATPPGLGSKSSTALRLGAVYEQLNAPFGQFATNTLAASTRALKGDDATYSTIESWIQSLTSQRDALAQTIRNALNAAAFNGQTLNTQQAKGWIDQAQSLIDQSANPPA